MARSAIARQIAAAAPGTDLDALLVATAIVESGLTPTAAGDGGRSHGVFQEYDLGRGAGIPIAGRRNVSAATSRAYREFSSLAGRFSGAELAYRAQRPADRPGYLRKISAALPEAQRLLGGVGTAAETAPPASREAAGGAPLPMPGAGRQITQESVALIRDYAERTRRQVLAGQMPESSRGVASRLRFNPAGGAVGAAGVAAAPQVDAGPVGAIATGWRPGGGPEAHATRALGDWQSDDAYDLMGETGDPVFAFVNGEVVKVSGQPGGDPGLAGYGITVRTRLGDLFFKHLGSKSVEVGDRITPRTQLGALDATTAAGPHLHLGGTNRSQLDRLYALMIGGRR